MLLIKYLTVREKQHSHHLALCFPINKAHTFIQRCIKTYILGSAVAQWLAHWPLETPGLGEGILVSEHASFMSFAA